MVHGEKPVRFLVCPQLAPSHLDTIGWEAEGLAER